MNFKEGDKLIAVEDEYAAYEDWVEVAAGDVCTVVCTDPPHFVVVTLDADEEPEDPEDDKTWYSVPASKLEPLGSDEARARLIEYYKLQLIEQDKKLEQVMAANQYYIEQLDKLEGTAKTSPLYKNTWDAYNDTSR